MNEELKNKKINLIELFIDFITCSGPSENRPPHIIFDFAFFAITVYSFLNTGFIGKNYENFHNFDIRYDDHLCK